MRLFVGLELDEPMRAALARLSAQLQADTPGSFHGPEMYHLTLAFLGEIAPERLPALKQTLSRVRFAPFSFAGEGLGRFEKGVLYCSVRTPNAPLFRLQADLCARLRGDGWPWPHQPYVPHITLARKVKEIARWPAVPEMHTQVGAFALFESARRDGKLCYTPIARWAAQEMER